MQLSETLVKVPQDLFQLKQNRMEQRIDLAGKHSPQDESSAAPYQNPGHKRH